MSKPGVARISISLPPTLLDEFDNVIQRIGYDRSKALQQATRDFITSYRIEYEQQASVVGTITLLFDHDIPGLEAELNAVQHRHSDLISSTTHIHLDGHHCLLIIVVKGQAKRIHQLTTRLQSLRGVQQIKLTCLATNK
ncbi:MAG: nickel-responsive transcriptional regulator NikR [Candidatus Hermodarchaeia archaeon]|jgi:CopG family nickel-responsive transcriptional regulator